MRKNEGNIYLHREYHNNPVTISSKPEEALCVRTFSKGVQGEKVSLKQKAGVNYQSRLSSNSPNRLNANSYDLKDNRYTSMDKH
jgi:hypothetical protein